MSRLILNPYCFSSSKTAFSETLNADDGGVAGYSFRNLTPTLLFGGTQVRVTFTAAAGSAWAVAHASVGISAGSGNTAATPIELLFSGASGFSLSAGQSIISDWATLTTTVSDALVAITDITSGAGRKLDTTSGCTLYYKAASSTYNLSAPGGLASLASTNRGVALIEVM